MREFHGYKSEKVEKQPGAACLCAASAALISFYSTCCCTFFRKCGLNFFSAPEAQGAGRDISEVKTPPR